MRGLAPTPPVSLATPQGQAGGLRPFTCPSGRVWGRFQSVKGVFINAPTGRLQIFPLDCLPAPWKWQPSANGSNLRFPAFFCAACRVGLVGGQKLIYGEFGRIAGGVTGNFVTHQKRRCCLLRFVGHLLPVVEGRIIHGQHSALKMGLNHRGFGLHLYRRV